MARTYENAHSRRVAWLKVLLPLTALALLSTLFLFSRSIDPEDAIPYADIDVADRLAEPRMVGVGFSGELEDGTALSLTADEAKPDPDGTASAQMVNAVIGLPDGGGSITLLAKVVEQNIAQGTARLSGGVTLTSSNGYDIRADGFDIGLSNAGVESQGKITAQGPLGLLESGKMRLQRNAAPNEKQFQLVFTDHVRVLYQPPKD